MKMKCLFSHDWYYLNDDTSYRFCNNCFKWEHLEFYSNRTSEWVECENPN